MKQFLTKDEILVIESDVFKLKLIIIIIGIAYYLSSIFFKLTSKPLTPILYISIIYLFVLIFSRFTIKRFNEEKIIYYYIFLAIFEIALATTIIYYTGGINSHHYILYVLIILSISAYRIENISFIVGILSYISYLILSLGEYFNYFKYVNYLSDENLNSVLIFSYKEVYLLV